MYDWNSIKHKYDWMAALSSHYFSSLEEFLDFVTYNDICSFPSTPCLHGEYALFYSQHKLLITYKNKK